MTSKNRTALAITAHHEAGHAVAAFYQRQSIRYVTITEDMDSRGHVRHYPLKFAREGQFDDSLRGIHRAECFIVIGLAGPLAQRRFAPRSHWKAGGGLSSSSIRSNPGSDFDMVTDFVFRIGGADQKHRDLYAKLLWRRAELLVDWHWKEIEAVAAELLDRRQLTADSVRDVIIGPLPT